MKIFISGAVTGVNNYEKLFKDTEIILTNAGYEVINPILLCDFTGDWTSCMHVTIKAMLDCDGIAVLNNWDKSKGSKIEVCLAKNLEKPIYDIDTWLLLADDK